MKKFEIDGVNIFKSDKDDQETLEVATASFDLKKKLKGVDRVVIKINLLVSEPYHFGSISDPFILEGIVKEIRKYSDCEIVVTDSESIWTTEYLLHGEASEKEEDILAGVDLALKNSGTKEIIGKYENVRFLDATKAPKADREAIRTLVKEHFPDNLTDVDEDMVSMVPAEFLDGNILFINYNKMKTHRMIGVGATLLCKNLFGLITAPNCVPYHDGGKGLLNSMLSINLIYNSIFQKKVGVVECLRYTIEGDGPDTEQGFTKKNAGLVVTGENFLAVDKAVCHLMAVDPKRSLFIEKLVPAYPKLNIDCESIPKVFVVPFRQPTHWEGTPPPSWSDFHH